jgi:hypothetical protein
MGTTQKVRPEGTTAKGISPYDILTNTRTEHNHEIARASVILCEAYSVVVGTYQLYREGALSPYITARIRVPQPADTAQDSGKFGFLVALGYGSHADLCSYTNLYGFAPGSAVDIRAKISKAFKLAKRFQNECDLQHFLRGSSDEAQQQPSA